MHLFEVIYSLSFSYGVRNVFRMAKILIFSASLTESSPQCFTLATSSKVIRRRSCYQIAIKVNAKAKSQFRCTVMSRSG